MPLFHRRRKDESSSASANTKSAGNNADDDDDDSSKKDEGGLDSHDWRAVAGEFLATAMFVWAGCGAAVSSNRWGEGGNLNASDLVAIALGFGLSITTLAYGFGHISGGHMNPAVTLAFVWMRTMSPLLGILYMIAQFVGAWFGALVLWGCTASLTRYCDDPEYGEDGSTSQAICDASRSPDGSYGAPFGLGANQVAPRVTNGCAFLLEGVGTFVLVLTILHAGVHPKSASGNATAIAIGWAILIVHLVLVPFTGCGINPARSFGPLAVSSMSGLQLWTRGWWVFFTAPWIGSLFATWTYQFIFRPPSEEGSEKKNKNNNDNDDDAFEVVEQRQSRNGSETMIETPAKGGFNNGGDEEEPGV